MRWFTKSVSNGYSKAESAARTNGFAVTGHLGQRTITRRKFRPNSPRSSQNGKRWIWCRRRRIPDVEQNGGAPYPVWDAYCGEIIFSPRQLLCHGTSVEVFREMLDAERENGLLDDVRKAAYGYLALSLDKLLNYNSRMSRLACRLGQ